MATIILNILILLVIQDAAAVSHSLKYFYTASSGLPSFPEYVSLGLVDDVPISHCDSKTRRAESTQEWMDRVDDPDYWRSETSVCQRNMETFKGNIRIAMKRFNQTGGPHVYQKMIGCEWDDETEGVKGFDQYGYDGEDFMVLNLETESWIAPKQEAFTTKQKWDRELHEKVYLNQVCVDWLKKYLNYGRNVLMRRDLPLVSFLQKTSSSPVSCHATGFYPNKAEIFWRKDGEEIHEGVEQGEIKPNNDGTYQMNVDIDLSSVATEDWSKYECVFQLSGEEDLVTKVEKVKIRTNEAPSSSVTMIIPIIVAVVVLAVIAVFGFILYKKKNAKRPPSPVDIREVEEEMIPKA